MHPKLYLLDWFESIKRYGSKPGLQTVKDLLSLLDDPQSHFDSIHVTGTNGKGSTTMMIASILIEAGYTVGVFTSPHLTRINESIMVNSEEINNLDMETILHEIREKSMILVGRKERHPTHFEVLTALAFTYFREKDVNIAVVEVGMGGRDDATNVIESLASVVTNVSLEHTQWLGDTLTAITENKASILRPDSTLITASRELTVISTLEKVAKKRDSDFLVVDRDYLINSQSIGIEGQGFSLKTPTKTIENLSIPLIGSHQLRNAACAVAAIETAQSKGYNISDNNIRKGLESVVWPGRFEIMESDPIIILDGAKDAAAIEALVHTMKSFFPKRNIVTILATSSDKANTLMINQLAEITNHFILTEHRVENRTSKASKLQKIAEQTGKTTEIIVPVKDAIKKAKKSAKSDDVILVTGSVFLIGEARECWLVQ